MKRLVTALLLTFASCAPATANEFANCGPIERVTEQLAVQYGESVHIALSNQQLPNNSPAGLMMFLANRETGTWTIVAIDDLKYPGLMCVVQSGTGYSPGMFQDMPPAEVWEGNGDPT